MKHGFVELVVVFCTTTNLIKKLNQFIEDFSLFIKQYCARTKKTEG